MRLPTCRHVLVALLAITASLAIASPVRAAGGGRAVLADCVKHLALTKTYPASALQDALQTMDAETSQYTNCRDVIQRALLIAQGKLKVNPGSLPGSSSGSSFLPTPVLVVLIVLALAALTLGAVALRRRRPPR